MVCSHTSNPIYKSFIQFNIMTICSWLSLINANVFDVQADQLQHKLHTKHGFQKSDFDFPESSLNQVV